MEATKSRLSPRTIQLAIVLFITVFAVFRYGLESVHAARVSDIRGTKHNLSASADGSGYTHPSAGAGSVPVRTAKASSETQVCIFCHTPHGASSSTKPLWNRKVAGAGYTPNYVLYDSSTLDAKQVQGSLMQPGGSSKLCLSCHDGTVAVGNVNVLNGLDKSGTAANSNVIAMQGGGTTMPTGSGSDTGFTRNLGTDLTNDHPISISYNDSLADTDGELRKPSLNTTLVGVRAPGVKPKLPLQNTGGGTAFDPDGAGPLSPYSINAQIQCTTCHDPHIRETNAAVGNQKFLRLNRFQEMNPPSSTGYVDADNAGDIICMACHDKGGASWAFSAHANADVANELYSNTHATRREFPTNLPVWKASCLNCHDTHAVAGTRRLLREGTNEGSSTAAAPKAGGAGTAALEETCYQCHDNGGNATLQSYSEVPDIKTDFSLAKRMPITSAAQGGGGNTTEVHEISGYFSGDSAFVDCTTKGTACGKDFVEPRSKLGVAALGNRHVECTDCHNPHRVIRGKRGLPGALNSSNTSETKVNGASGGHHNHTESTGYTHNNVISGVLRGSWGVQPTYSSNRSFHNLPSGYVVKRGDPGSANVADCHGIANKAACDSASYVTREFQICLKCHSDYGYSDNNSHSSTGTLGNRPPLGYPGGTMSGQNGLTMYTNQAKEFQAPPEHQGAPASTSDSGAHSSFASNNYRSWHPVMDTTGRGLAERGNITAGNNPWRSPWNNSVGSQTMYCTDCHGSSTAATTAIPSGSSSWGPHGSGNDFILKGAWTDATGSTANLLCFKCHNSAAYVGGETNTKNTGFWQSSKGNLHRYHNARIGGALRCTWCHVAVPHGWKNKALLVNLRDVGREAGLADGTHIADSVAINGYTKEPYYYKAVNKVKTFKASGNWAIGDCGNGDSDKWMRANPDAAKGEGICNNPP